MRLTVDGVNLFYGFIFTQKRDKAGAIDITAYDQLRYLKNKDSYIYENKTAGQLVQMIATDFHLQCGEIADTGFVIDYRVEDSLTLFDTIQNALDLTLINRKKLYVLYDDFGKLTLKNIENRVENIESRVENIEERTLKLEITQENVTNKHIALLMEGQQLNAKKLKAVDQKLEKLDNIEAGVVALEAITMQNTIKIKEKIG